MKKKDLDFIKIFIVMAIGIFIGFIIGRSDNLSQELVNIFVFTIFIGTFSLMIVYSFGESILNYFRKEKSKIERKERRVFKLIKDLGGKVTPMDIATNTNLTFEESKIFLDKLVDSCSGTHRFDEEGNISYLFDKALREDRKKFEKELYELTKEKKI